MYQIIGHIKVKRTSSV